MAGTNPSRAGASQIAKERERILRRILEGERAGGLGADDVFQVVQAPRGYSQTTESALSQAGYNPSELSVLSGSYDGPSSMAEIFDAGLVNDELRRDLLGSAERTLAQSAADGGLPFSGSLDQEAEDSELAKVLRAAGYQAPKPVLTREQERAAARQGWEPPSSGGGSSSAYDDVVARYQGGGGALSPSPAPDAPAAGAPAATAGLAGVSGNRGTLETQQSADRSDGFWSNVGQVARGWFTSDQTGNMADAARRVGEAAGVVDEEPAPLYPPLEDEMTRIQEQGPTEGSEQRFDEAYATQGRIDTLNDTRTRADQLGVEDTTDDRGALSWILDSLQKPQSLAIGAATGLAGGGFGDGGERDGEEGLSPVERAWSRVNDVYMNRDRFDWQDVSGVEADDFGDGESWQSTLGRGAFHVSNFVGNVGSDPLTYTTAGSGGLSRRGASEGVERSVQAAAGRAGRGDLAELGAEAQERLLTRMGDEATFSTRVASEVAKVTDVGTGARGAAGRRVVGVHADDVANALAGPETRAGVLEAFEKIGMDPTVRRNLLGEGLENMAAESFMRGGATAARRQLATVFGDDAVYDALDVSLRGGVQGTIPFASRAAEFGRAPITAQAPAALRKGLRPGAEAASDLYNATRRYVAASPVGKASQTVFGGRNSTELKGLTRAMREGSEETAGAAWSQFRAARDAGLIRGEVANQMTTKNRLAFLTVSRHLQEVAHAGFDPADAKEAMSLHMSARGSATFDAASGRTIQPDGSLGEKVVERGLDDLAPEVVAAGAAAEQQMADTMREMAERLIATAPDGDDGMNLLNHYTPRRIAEDAAAEQASARSGRTNHAKARSGVFAVWKRDPTTGELTVDSFMSPVEAGAAGEARIAPATGRGVWRNPVTDGSQPVTVTGPAESVGGRAYVNVEGSSTPVPRDEVVFEAAEGVSGVPVKFNTDPTELMADYVSSLERAVDVQTVLKTLDQRGMLTRPRSAAAGSVDERGVAEALAPASAALSSARQAATVAGAVARGGDGVRARELLGPVVDILGEGEAQKLVDALPSEEIRNVGGTWAAGRGDTLRKFDSFEEAVETVDRETLSAAYDQVADAVLDATLADAGKMNELLDIRNMPYDDPEGLADHIESLVNVVGRWTGQSSAATKRQLESGRQVASDYQRRITESGWEALSEEGRDVFALRSLAESGAFAPSQIAEALGRQYRAQTRTEAGAFLMDKVWQPYFTGFKTTATVGRGPGFSIRNAGGGMWNGYLSGATATHFKTAERMMRYEASAKRRVLSEIRESGEILSPDDMTGRIKDAVRTEFESKFRGERGARLFDALEAFYDRNLMAGTRTDEFNMQTGKGLAGGEGGMSRYAGGPGGSGFGDDPMAQLSRWQNLLSGSRPTRAAQVDAMDPALAEGAGVSNTMFPGKQRSELGRTGRAAQAVTDNPWVRANSQLAEVSEKYTRLAPFLSGLDRFGLDDGGRAASLGVKATQFDYGDLSETERRYLRNLMPFYTFSRNNIPLQIRGAMQSPEKLAKLGHAWESTQDAFGEDERWDETIFPRWVRENLGFVTNVSPNEVPGAGLLSQVPVLGRMFESGSPIAVNMSTLPVTDLEKITSSPRDEAVSMLNPMLKVPLELGLDIDTFTRGEPPDSERLMEPLQGQGWLDVLPGVDRAADGTMSVKRAPVHTVRQMVPPVSQIERLLGSTERYGDRMLTSWLSNMAGAPVSTLDDFQISGEAGRSQKGLSRDIGQMLGPTIDKRQVYDAIDKVGEAVVRQAIESGRLPDLLADIEAAS